MSYREKATWAGLIVLLGVWGMYFAGVGLSLARDGLDAPELVGSLGGRFVAAVSLLIVVEIGAAILIALVTPEAEQMVRDERERLATLRSDSLAFGLLWALLLVLASGTYFFGVGRSFDGVGPTLPTPNAFALLANAVLFCLLSADAVRYAVRLWLLRAPV